ncbi:DUF6456 domain-containing protein [Jannaschia sp. W003]|uniref:DUF6456 domain-containing protein n=1 Tax=Jannaschia sp. W003 TaxID=2867012 RepID=UPI0021A26406|nr:DUF6456 domain-containing protein [Jannaschia sp. W003]UWQ20267.1 DUF6456 domain-containing protein [Jannaschia sp. W003]
MPRPSTAESPVLPRWVPEAARLYIAHACGGRPLRDVADEGGCSAATVMRKVRRVEAMRDDPNVDDALERLARAAEVLQPERSHSMSMLPPRAELLDDETLDREARRVLRRLCEGDAFLAVAQGMPQAAVLRGGGAGDPARIATLPRPVAQAFVLKDWVRCTQAGRVTRYRITDAGRAALRRLLGEHRARRTEARGMAEAHSPFLAQQGDYAEITRPGAEGDETLRVNLAESPLGALARRKDRDGRPFLPRDLLVAGETLRGDFEAAQMGPRLGQNWERFLTAGTRGDFGARGPCEGPSDARAQVAAALRALGPGLGDVALRVCCYLEGIEAAEKRMGWAARSGKVVLRIALQRLHMHYIDSGRM